MVWFGKYEDSRVIVLSDKLSQRIFALLVSHPLYFFSL